jgi:hypothetical protein
MGKLLNGIHGPFMGKVGNIVGSTWHGMPYIKTKPKKRTTNISKKEKQNRSKFALVHFWLQPVVKFVRDGFRNYSFNSRGFNAAKSYNLKHAVIGTAPDISIDPALVKVSFGTLPIPGNITVEKLDDEHLKFTWDPAAAEDTSFYDQAMVLAYCVEKKYPCYTTTGELRHSGEHIQPVGKGLKYHVYFAFNAADRSRQSDSVYLGEVQM